MRKVTQGYGRWLGLAAVLAMAGCPAADNSSGAIRPNFNQKSATVPENAESVADHLIALVNAARTEHGLPPVRKSPVLMKLAEDYAARMIERGFFSHIDPETGYGPGQRALQAGYLFLSVGENLGANQTSPEAVMDDWMSSTEGHRESILSAQWNEVGAAVRTGGEHGIYWVLEFGNTP
jgi:uncharacterized protein YkwD